MNRLFNNEWQFAKLSISNPQTDEGKNAVLLNPCDFYSKRPENCDYRKVEIPHDYLIYDTNDLYENSVGFYRKEFDLAETVGKKYALRFGGVYMNSAVYVNGQLAGVWKYGYTTFEFDVTPFVNCGKNLVEVICVYQSPNTRWYSGAGIFRDVYLIITKSARIACDGVYFSAKDAQLYGISDNCSENKSNECFENQSDNRFENQSDNCSDAAKFSPPSGKWYVKIQTEISGEYEGCSVKHVIFPYHDNTENALSLKNEIHSTVESKILQPAMGTAFNPDEKILVETTTALIENPALWEIDFPSVYILQTQLLKDGVVIDEASTQIGFKKFYFDCNKGLILNGKHVKICGVCEHHDLGSLGSAFNLTALKRKFTKLKEMGVNAIRTSHNPQDTEFLNLADRMGFLTDDECFDMWEKTKTAYDYGNYFVEWHERDCAAWVRRNRNHPSLILWSIGNEIYDTHAGNGFQITKNLYETVRRFDSECNGLVTIGSNYMEWEGAQRCAAEIDVAGYNYGERLYNLHHEKYPEWCLYGSETASTVQSRGVYHFPASNRVLTYMDGQCSSLGNCSTNWGAVNSSWCVTTDRDAAFSAGQFLWTGWDYIGEPTPFFSKNSFFGQIDTAGFKKDTFYAYKAGWIPYKKEPFVHLLPYWDYNEGQLIDVCAFTNAPSVELFKNEKSFGRQSNNPEKDKELSHRWQIVYEPGEICAVAYDENGKEIARETKKSFGDSEKITVNIEKESDDGLFFLDISTCDKNDVPVENSKSRIFIEVTGDAVLAGLDNGDSTDYEQYKSADGKKHNRRLFNNALLAIIKCEIRSDFSVKVSSIGMKSQTLVFKSGKYVTTLESDSVETGENFSNKEIPVRKIEMLCNENRSLSAENRSVSVKAIIHPKNATCRKIDWIPLRLECVKSDSAEISVTRNSSFENVIVTAAGDGDFRLTCTSSNDREIPEVISELEFNVSGLGTSAKNPYELIEACKCSSSFAPVKLSFLGGVFTEETRSWFSFEKLDFGEEGSDAVTLPIFSFNNEVDVELWEGNPDNGGTLLMPCHYKAKSWYNHYQSNTFILPRRLFGLHEVTVLFNNRMSLQGILFEKSRKAFAKLNALDANTITGDAFTRSTNSVTGIGNNVSLEFDLMNFEDTPCSSITICGFSHVDNTIHVKFTDENGTVNRILEFPETQGIEEKTFTLEGVKGRQKLTFLFLPGSNFDFHWFKLS